MLPPDANSRGAWAGRCPAQAPRRRAGSKGRSPLAAGGMKKAHPSVAGGFDYATPSGEGQAAAKGATGCTVPSGGRRSQA